MLSNLETLATARAPKSDPLSLVTVLYEDLPAGLRARALMESVDDCMDAAAQFKLDLWRFDWLHEPSLANVSLRMGKRAAVVLISASTNKPLPRLVEKWINAWAKAAAANSLSTPLILLLPRQPEMHRHQHPVQTQLASIAQQHGVNFLCEHLDPSAKRNGGHVRSTEDTPVSKRVELSDRRSYCRFN